MATTTESNADAATAALEPSTGAAGPLGRAERAHAALRCVLLDSGGANLGSVQAALARLGVDAPVTADAGRIREASHVILPGVGAAEPGMQRAAPAK